MKEIFAVYLLTCVLCKDAQNNADAILGKWMTLQGNLEVEVYKQNNEFRAKILWFKDTDDKTRPMESRVDDKNPDKSLRSRKWIGMNVLRNLRYNAEEKRWENGKVYVAKNGKEWDSVAWITKEELLKVKGYWLFEFLGQTLTFKKIKQ